ncbi:purine permease [Limosilactobacillus sp. RRLNB_1_1]|uniref:Purine permease n=2 Tax=Limosilactobacillus TaxID=2742598 RepID=A0A7W3TSU3_9LACO|nr:MULTISPECIES: nucleobase:cation symporter-2 family protein [Limosilactobacillus]MRH45447.1 purine permease [Limosilactobacillus reuteri]MBB1070056.1 purine permease [Limosilactobacillus albertensis]MBB1124035.1 purine permease [Limosilactobacillus albertensis]MCD7117293.1 purine permease [Limosilactobacillus albertensis]MCD7121753.1 purine permease [Limosilactobacillus albertensis]
MKEPVSSIQAPSHRTKLDFTRQWQNFILGFQHLLAMYSGDVLVPLLIGHYLHFTTLQMTYLVSIDIFMCGIATLLQLKQTPLTGIGLPVVLGCAVQAVTPLETIGGKLGITYMYGAIIAAGIFVFLIAGFFARLKKLFPPVVTGSLITIIGFTLVPVGFQDLGGGTPTAASFGAPANLFIGFLTIIIILVFNAFARGFMKSIAILLGILISSFIAGAMGFVSLKPVSEAAWFHAPQLFFFGIPRFDTSAMITMILVSLTTMIESTGVFFALSDITGRQLTTKDLERGYRAEGIAAVLGGLFNTFPYSTFSENVGVLKMSGVKSRQPVYYAAFLLLLLGLLPKVGALATVIPEPVLGGAMIVMFGMVGVQGVQILHKVDFSNNANLLTASVSIGLGLGITMYPQLFQHMPTEFQIILGNGIVVTSISAVLLNLLFNHRWASAN